MRKDSNSSYNTNGLNDADLLDIYAKQLEVEELNVQYRSDTYKLMSKYSVDELSEFEKAHKRLFNDYEERILKIRY